MMLDLTEGVAELFLDAQTYTIERLYTAVWSRRSAIAGRRGRPGRDAQNSKAWAARNPEKVKARTRALAARRKAARHAKRKVSQ